MGYYPILLELEGKTALVVGGGSVAQRKIEGLLQCGASINIICRKLSHRLKELVDAKTIRHLGNEFRNEHMEGAFLVIAATDDKLLNQEVSKIARESGILVNAVDQPLDCNFILPSVVRRGDLLIGISTSGNSPALAKKIRQDLEKRFGQEYAAFLRLMGHLRKKVLSRGLPQEENGLIFQRIIDSGVLEALSRDDWKDVESILMGIIPDNLAVDISSWIEAFRKKE